MRGGDDACYFIEGLTSDKIRGLGGDWTKLPANEMITKQHIGGCACNVKDDDPNVGVEMRTDEMTTHGPCFGIRQVLTRVRSAPDVTRSLGCADEEEGDWALP